MSSRSEFRSKFKFFSTLPDHRLLCSVHLCIANKCTWCLLGVCEDALAGEVSMIWEAEMVWLVAVSFFVLALAPPWGRNCQEGHRTIRQTDEPSQLFSDSVGNELPPLRPWGGGCCPPRAYGGVGDGVPHIMSQCDGMAPCSKSLHGGGCAYDLAYPCAPGSGWNPKPGRAVASSANK